MSSLFNTEDVLSWANRDKAEAYVGKEGYFADSLEKLEGVIKNRIIYTLIEVGVDVSCFREGEYKFRFGLFLPTDKVLPVPIRPKKYRPFRTVEEFSQTLGVKELLGAKMTYKRKDNNLYTYNAIVTQHTHESRDDQTIFCSIRLGETVFSLCELFNNP